MSAGRKVRAKHTLECRYPDVEPVDDIAVLIAQVVTGLDASLKPIRAALLEFGNIMTARSAFAAMMRGDDDGSVREYLRRLPAAKRAEVAAAAHALATLAAAETVRTER